MGWWWNSSPHKDELSSSSSATIIAPPTPSTSGEERPRPQPASSSANSHPPRQLTRDEQAEAEIKELLAQIQETNEWDDSSSSRQLLPSAPSSHAILFPDRDDTSTNNNDSEFTSPPSSIVPESLYPDTMSCRSAFDYAFFCQSFGGQWVNVYRYGELRSCSEHWHNFWLCMKANAYPEEEGKKKMIRDHYRKKAIRYKTGPSSEDVWEVRTEPLRGAFEGDFAALERLMKEEEEGGDVRRN